jgi:DNA polymerase, archaea type
MTLAPANPETRRAWLEGWDDTTGIVSVHADGDGHAIIWRRVDGQIILERDQFRPWVYAEHLDHLAHVGERLRPDARGADAPFTYTELPGDGAFKYLIQTRNWSNLKNAILEGAKRADRDARSLNDLHDYYALGLTEQYLIATGKTCFKDLEYRDLVRLQFDLETTGFRASDARIILIAVRDSTGFEALLEAPKPHDEAQAIRDLVRIIKERDPDVIENHNLVGFDLPFLEGRANALGIRLEIGRAPAPTLLRREGRNDKFSVPGRELIDTLDAVWRHDFVTRELPSHRLKDVAKHFGLAAKDRVYIAGAEIATEYERNPDRVRAYALEDVREVDRLSARLLPASFALTRLAPRRFERVASAGMATGILEPMLVRAYHRAGRALPRSTNAYLETPHEGGALFLFAQGLARNVVKADIASLYPSIMRAYRIGPACDELGVLIELVDELTRQRLDHKAAAKRLPKTDPEFARHDANQAAMKLIINSAYGYLAAGQMALFADRFAADRITATGREILQAVINGLRVQGVGLLEADTDGVYFTVPDDWDETKSRQVVHDLSQTLPEGITLEFDALYAAMLSHDLKNYALLTRDDQLILRGVAFRSSRFEPFGQRFLETAVRAALEGSASRVRDAYLETVQKLRERQFTARDVSSRAKLKKSHDKYTQSRSSLREAPYEAMLQSGKTWLPGERIRWYRAQGGVLRALPADEEDHNPLENATDYDAQHYIELLTRVYAQKLKLAFDDQNFDQVFRNSAQENLFDAPAHELVVHWVKLETNASA